MFRGERFHEITQALANRFILNREIVRDQLNCLWLAPFSYCGLGVKPSVQRLSGDECPCRVMVLSAVGVSRRMMVSEAPAS